MSDTTFHTLHGTIWENTTLRFQRLSGFTHSAKMTIQSSIKSWTNSEVFLSSDARQSMWSASTYAVWFVGHWVLHIISNTGFQSLSSGPLSSQSWKRSGFASLQIIERVGVQVGHVLAAKQAMDVWLLSLKGLQCLWEMASLCLTWSDLDASNLSESHGRAKRAFHLGGRLTLLLFLRRMGGIKITLYMIIK